MWKIFLIFFVLLIPTFAQADFPITEVVKVSSIDLTYPSGGAIERARIVLDEIGTNPDYARMIVKPTVKQRTYGAASTDSWYAYTSQDAKTSWIGEGMAAYSLWS
jgi:hypothetical protein